MSHVYSRTACILHSALKQLTLMQRLSYSAVASGRTASQNDIPRESRRDQHHEETLQKRNTPPGPATYHDGHGHRPQPRAANIESRASITEKVAQQNKPALENSEGLQTVSGEPQDNHPAENVYVLTLLTDDEHYHRMTALRRKYFPPKLYFVHAHLTLFHALPESKLADCVEPVIEKIAKGTKAFEIVAAKPWQMTRGFGVKINSSTGGNKATHLRERMRKLWQRHEFLTKQDQHNHFLHYTFMNKVNDKEEVERAYEEFTSRWKEDRGTALGFVLWKYNSPTWEFHKKWLFRTDRGYNGDGQVQARHAEDPEQPTKTSI